MKSILYSGMIFSIVVILSCGSKTGMKNLYTIDLKTDRLESYDMQIGGAVLWTSQPERPFYEAIKKYPENCNIKETYNICLQGKQWTYHNFTSDTLRRKKFFNRNPDERFEEWQKSYTEDTLDCIVSLCSIEDSSGDISLIIDKNNDEDLSNDSIERFQTIHPSNNSKDTTVNLRMIFINRCIYHSHWMVDHML